jgi:hypothetical protein
VSLSQLSGCLSCQHGISLERLLPHLAGVAVEAAELADGLLCIWACVRADRAACPRCGHPSGRVHSSYERRWKDALAGGHRVLIRLGVRRFFCGNPECAAVTFAEQVAGLTARRARRTPPLARTLSAIAAALAGRAGARLAARLDLAAGRTGLLRWSWRCPTPSPPRCGCSGWATSRSAAAGTTARCWSTPKPASRWTCCAAARPER